jgi:hypothetical protein
MPHHLLQCGNAHVLVCFMRAKGMTECVDTHLLADTSLFHIFGDDILDRGDVEGRAVFGQEEYLIVLDKLGVSES